MPALPAVCFNSAMRAFKERLASRGKKAKVIPTAVASKMLVIVNAVVRNKSLRDAEKAVAR